MDALIRRARRARLDRIARLGISGGATATDSKIDETLKPMQERFAQLRKENEEIVNAVEVKDGVLTIETEQQARFQSNLEEMKGLKGQIEGFLEAKNLAEWGTAEAGNPLAVTVQALVEQLKGSQDTINHKSLGRRFVESEQFKRMLAAGWDKMDAPFEVGGPLGYVRKDIYSDLPSGTPGAFGSVTRDPIVPLATQLTPRVRDLFPARPTTSALIEYFRVTGFTNAASVVPQRTGGAFTTKPHSSLTIVGAQAPVRRIAHYELAHRDTLSDEPALQALIETELMYGLRLAEDNQIINGTGTGEDLLGIINTPGVQTTAVTGNIADRIRKAMTLVFLSGYEATGVVLHPSDWESLELMKSAGPEALYLFTQSLQSGGQPRVWSVPVVQSQAITAGNGLVGAFGLGAQLYDREQANIRIGEPGDTFLQNAVAVLAESRLALAVKRPEAFWYGDVTP